MLEWFLTRVVLCRSGTALPPTPNRDSKRNEVEAWLGWFGKSINLGNLRIRRLQAAFSVDGESLLSFSVTDCQQYCQQAGIQPAIGASMYRRLHSGVVRCSIAPHRYLSIFLSSHSQPLLCFISDQLPAFCFLGVAAAASGASQPPVTATVTTGTRSPLLSAPIAVAAFLL